MRILTTEKIEDSHGQRKVGVWFDEEVDVEFCLADYLIMIGYRTFKGLNYVQFTLEKAQSFEGFVEALRKLIGE